MLYFFDSTKDIPKDIKIIKSNDSFFNAHTKIPDTKFALDVLGIIDKAERVSEISFKGRSDKFGNLDRQQLSTGTKTLLNIIQNNNICFNISECGFNVLEILFTINKGYIYCDRYLDIPLSNDDKCDIFYRNKEFNSIMEFRKFYEEVYDAEHTDKL